jgi:hypothetical protein
MRGRSGGTTHGQKVGGVSIVDVVLLNVLETELIAN